MYTSTLIWCCVTVFIFNLRFVIKHFFCIDWLCLNHLLWGRLQNGSWFYNSLHRFLWWQISIQTMLHCWWIFCQLHHTCYNILCESLFQKQVNDHIVSQWSIIDFITFHKSNYLVHLSAYNIRYMVSQACFKDVRFNDES